MIHVPLGQSGPQPAHQRSPPAIREQRAAPLAVARVQSIELSVKLIGEVAAQRLAADDGDGRPNKRLPAPGDEVLPRALVPGGAGPREHQIAEAQPAKEGCLLSLCRCCTLDQPKV